MNAIRTWFRKKYLTHILLSLTVLSVLVLLLSSFAVYLRSKKTILQLQEEASLKVLSQIDNSLQYMNRIVNQSATSSYFDSDAQYIMNMKSLDYMELAPRMDRVSKWLSTAAFLDSIILYNPKLDMFYSTRYTGDFNDDSLDGSLKAYLRKYDWRPPRLEPISLTRGEPGNASGGLITFLIYETNANGLPSGIMAYNVKAGWFEENLNKLQKVDGSAAENLLIVDKEGVFVQSNDGSGTDYAQLLPTIRALDEARHTFVQKNVDGKKQIFTFIRSQIGGWHMVSIHDYNAVYQGTNKLWLWVISTLSVVGILTVAVSIIVARRLYRPVQAILTEFSEAQTDGVQGVRDEFELIRHRYTDTLQLLKRLRSDYEGKANSLQSYFFRKWLLDSTAITVDELSLCFPADPLKEEPFKPHLYRICLLQIDHYRAFQKRYSAFDQKLIQFAISNIAGEILGRHFSNHVGYISDGHFAAILQMSDNQEERHRLTETVHACLHEIKQSILDYYHVSLSAADGEELVAASKMSDAYSRAQDIARYRILYGHGCLIPATVLASSAAECKAETGGVRAIEWEKTLGDSLRSGNMQLVGQQLQELESHLRSLSYNEIIRTLFTSMTGIMMAIQDINRNGMMRITMDSKMWYDMIFEHETLADMFLAIGKALEDICGVRKQEKTKSTHTLLVEATKDIIDEHMADLNLGASMAAEMLHIQSAQLKKIFREATGLSLHEYIHQIRLNKARALLETTEYTVHEITAMVGFANQSYFFQLFKQLFGVTPREYRQRNMLERA